MSNTDYDVVVIGAGPGGYVAAIHAAQSGMRTAIVERDKNLGGTCGLRGCIPTKALLESAHIYEQSKHASDFGVITADVKLDFEGVQKYKNKIVLKSAKGVEYLMNKNKIKVLKGHGRIEDPNTVSVTAADGNKQSVSTKFILVATGSVPRDIPIFPTDGVRIINSDHILELKNLPKSLCILGAGAVGTEFASIYSRFGVDVTLVEMLPRLLPIEDEAISAELERAIRGSGIKVKTSTMCQSAAVKENSVEVTLKNEKTGEISTLEIDQLLVAIGRRPVSENLGLDKTKVVVERGYLGVNGYMQTAEPSIYAIGDVVNTPWLAHVASHEGILAIDHMRGVECHPINYDHVPNCTYCEPEVGSVGLTEAKARERGHDVKVGSFPFMANGKARILNSTAGIVKIVSDAKYGEILGVHIVGPRATELIAEACVALTGELTVEDLMHTIHAHPTLSEAVHEAVHSAHGAALHM